jgi:DNA-binding beta-propeller fold protein YncE
VLPDSSAAFVSSAARSEISVVDLRRKVFLTNLSLPAPAADLVVKPDGGELYVTTPGAHGMEAINTWTNEVADSMVLGSAPTRAILSADSGMLFVSDSAAGRITPVLINERRVLRPIQVGQQPGACRFDRVGKENLLLVVNEGSGDLAVIRIRTGSLLTMIPVGDRPRDIAVKLF